MILALLQARISSSRLPGKVMLPLCGEPMLARQIERVLRSTRIDKLVVATSDLPEDRCLAGVAEAAGVGCFMGALDDVLDRFYHAARPHQADAVVRLTGDCPLIDWNVIDRCIDTMEEGGFDYVSNTLQPTWPDGLDVEVMTFAALAIAHREAENAVQREHVTPFINRDPARFRLGSVQNDVDLSAFRWTVDEPADYAFVARIYDGLFPTNPAFTTDDVLALLAREPALLEINAGFERNEGLRKAEDALLKGSAND